MIKCNLKKGEEVKPLSEDEYIIKASKKVE